MNKHDIRILRGSEAGEAILDFDESVAWLKNNTNYICIVTKDGNKKDNGRFGVARRIGEEANYLKYELKYLRIHVDLDQRTMTFLFLEDLEGKQVLTFEGKVLSIYRPTTDAEVFDSLFITLVDDKGKEIEESRFYPTF